MRSKSLQAHLPILLLLMAVVCVAFGGTLSAPLWDPLSFGILHDAELLSRDPGADVPARRQSGQPAAAAAPVPGAVPPVRTRPVRLSRGQPARARAQQLPRLPAREHAVPAPTAGGAGLAPVRLHGGQLRQGAAVAVEPRGPGADAPVPAGALLHDPQRLPARRPRALALVLGRARPVRRGRPDRPGHALAAGVPARLQVFLPPRRAGRARSCRPTC